MEEPGSPGWHQIRVNLPDDVYTILRARAARHGTSLSAEALHLMQLGLANVQPNDNIAAALTTLQRYVELHLEPLIFIAAMDAAAGREYWKNMTLQSAAQAQYPDPPKIAEDGDRTIGEKATRRIQRKLRGAGQGGESDRENHGA